GITFEDANGVDRDVDLFGADRVGPLDDVQPPGRAAGANGEAATARGLDAGPGGRPHQRECGQGKKRSGAGSPPCGAVVEESDRHQLRPVWERRPSATTPELRPPECPLRGNACPRRPSGPSHGHRIVRTWSWPDGTIARPGWRSATRSHAETSNARPGAQERF